MDLLDKLKLLRDDLNLMIENEEAKRPYQSTVGKSFSERLCEKMMKKEEKIFEEQVKELMKTKRDAGQTLPIITSIR